MQTYDKLNLSMDMLVEAHKAYEESDSSISYVKSILLSGAAVNILHPYLDEMGITPTQTEFAKLVDAFSQMDTGKVVPISDSLYFTRLIYNSLKHSGDNRNKIKPSQDLTFDADLEPEAFSLLNDGVGDLRKLVDRQLMPANQLTDDARDLLQWLPISKRNRCNRV